MSGRHIAAIAATEDKRTASNGRLGAVYMFEYRCVRRAGSLVFDCRHAFFGPCTRDGAGTGDALGRSTVGEVKGIFHLSLKCESVCLILCLIQARDADLLNHRSCRFSWEMLGGYGRLYDVGGMGICCYVEDLGRDCLK